ncbi:hypothetical protein CLIB1423_17S00100 [[Candida] railenensis]|uniref:DUF3835 domain-containing protein n=1 Tax=[Candida] railenensis TaxID=45579 RepID=A0A9P0QT80_9ASCO|nr:hypothetical protein CLIB1423_17S00100 [[Candida] railenensis]
MVQEAVDPDFSTSAIKQQLSSVIDNLSSKVNELQVQEGKYDELMNNITGDKVIMSIGDGYFAEYSHTDARSFLSRRIDNINNGIKEIEGRIREAKGTLRKFEEYSKLTGLQEDGAQSDDKIQESDIENGKYNEEGLPYMDIREELDENGNVLNVKINDGPMRKTIDSFDEHDDDDGESTPDNYESPHIERDLSGTADDKDEIEETGPISSNIKESVVQEVAEDEGSAIMDIVEVLDDSGNVVSSSVKPAKSETSESGASKSKLVEGGTRESIPEGQSINGDEDEDEMNQVNELLYDMEIIQNPEEKANEDELLNKIDKLDITADDKFRLKLILLDEYRKINEEGDDAKKTITSTPSSSKIEAIKESDNSVEDDIENNTSFTNFPSGSLAMNSDEILELELLADDFDEGEGEAEFADDEEWDFEFSEDDEDEEEDDDLADELLYGKEKPEFISNNGVNSRLWDEVMSRRQNSSEKDIDKESTKTSHASNSKKSVRFATELDIFEIENVSQELKKIQHVNQNFSRFKQERMVNKIDEIDESFEDGEQGEQETAAVSELVMEKLILGEPEPMQDLSKKKSRFRMMREENDLKSDVQKCNKKENISKSTSTPATSATSNKITELEQPSSDIIEREQPVNDIIEREQPFSDIIEREQLVNNTIARVQPLSDIIERDPLSTGAIEDRKEVTADAPAPRKAVKKSRFKMQRDSPGVNASNPPHRSITTEKIPIEDDKPLDRRMAIEQSIADIEDKDIVSEENMLSDRTDGVAEDIEDEGDDIKYVETTIDYQSMQNDMDTMAKAYVLGMYDDDIVTEGPVVDKLQDFEEINKIIDENEKANIAVSGVSGDNEGSDEDEQDEDEDEGPVLLDIVENDTNFNAADEDEVEDNIIQDEVQNNYHRLRRQMMQARERGYRKTEEELQYEPIDEDGNPIKVSRFRAARFR